MTLALIGHGVFPYNPLVLIAGGAFGVIFVLPAYYCLIAWTCRKAAKAGATRVWAAAPAALPIIYGVSVIVWACRESVWFTYTSTYGTTVGGVRVGEPSMHLAGVLTWCVLTVLPYVLLAVLQNCKRSDRGPAA